MFDPDPVYNTIMAVGTGVALLLLVAIGARIANGGHIHRSAYAVAIGAIGVILFLTGLHMSLVWPLSGPTAFDNIVFGEPVLALGTMLIAGSYLLGSRKFWPADPSAADPDGNEIGRDAWSHLAKLLQPLSWFGAAMGLGLVAIAFVGPFYTPWEAPPQEPISGEFSDVEWLENTFISLLYLITAIGALVLPFALMRRSLERAVSLLKVVGACWAVAGVIFVGFGAMNYYTHVGLTINTYEESVEAEAGLESLPEAEGIIPGAPAPGP